ncbi:MAG: oligosaccharide flippase family protein [Flavobacteriales bacterium]|nr:oligosaccharide flippase family protein [Flavobacteriales bacterium]
MAGKKFYSDVAFVQVINILIKAVWILLVDRAIQNTLPPEDYGRYFGLLAFSILFIIVLDLGINSMNTREVARDPDFFRKHFRNILLSKLLFAAGYLVLLAAASLAMGFGKEDARILIPLAAMQIAISFNSYLRSNIAAHHKFKLDGLFAVLDRLLVIAVCGTWLLVPEWRENLTIHAFVYVQLSGVLLSFLGLMVVNSRMLNGRPDRFNPGFLRSLLLQTLPFALLAALMSIYTRMDAVMLKDMLGNEEANEYAMGYRLLDALNMVAVLLAGILLPMFSSRLEETGFVRKLSMLSARILVVPALVLAVIAMMHGEWLIALLYPMKWTADAAACFGILMVCFLPIALVYVYGTLLTAAKTLRFLNILALFCVLMNLGLNLILIPRKGILGAAWATLVTQSIFALGCMFNAQRRLKALAPIGEYLRLIVLLGAVIATGIVLRQYFDNPPVHMALLFATAGSVAWILGLIRSRDFKVLMRRKA